MSQTTALVIGAVIGAVTSIAANALWHFITLPRLVIRDPERTSIQETGHFWGSRVSMAEPGFVSRNPALAVQATLQVRDPATGQVLRTFTCRWQGTPQPVVPTAPNQYVPNIAGLPFGQRGDVYQHKSEAVDLFVKFDGEQEFYGFPNEAYFHNWHHPDFCFRGSRYLATLAVRHDQDEHLLDLEVLNPSTRGNDFRIVVVDRRASGAFGPLFRSANA